MGLTLAKTRILSALKYRFTDFYQYNFGIFPQSECNIFFFKEARYARQKSFLLRWKPYEGFRKKLG